MKKLVVFILLVLFLVSCTTLKPYDSDEVKMAMQTIMQSAKDISGSLEMNDLSKVPMAFSTLKNEFDTLAKMEAPKGAADQWTMMHQEMSSLSMEGEEAAKNGDAEKVGQILGKLFEFQKKGHSTFK